MKEALDIEVRVYPGTDGTFTLYEDEDDNYNYERGQYTTIAFDYGHTAEFWRQFFTDEHIVTREFNYRECPGSLWAGSRTSWQTAWQRNLGMKNLYAPTRGQCSAWRFPADGQHA